MESFQGLGGGGRDHAYRYGHMKLPRDEFAALRKVDLHKELCLPWISGFWGTRRHIPLEWKLGVLR